MASLRRTNFSPEKTRTLWTLSSTTASCGASA
ncbi:unnamed protein product [Dibothriocephalus latus]|uniref:Uncharacterized protein n=1 Tax=Dibothriocephalus latus TaxID=60516 RepID=A0A3P7NN32_DIBLA|nr:unnamed protein product [Dibothriocephalus latus]